MMRVVSWVTVVLWVGDVYFVLYLSPQIIYTFQKVRLCLERVVNELSEMSRSLRVDKMSTFATMWSWEVGSCL